MNQSNLEMMQLATELESLLPHLSTLKMPLLAIQGEDDRLVYPENADYLEQQMEQQFAGGQITIERWKDSGHFLLWKQRQRVTERILRFINATDP